MTILLQFKFPVNLTVKQFISQLNNEIKCQSVSSRHYLKTYYDSFDWRLYSKNLVCEFIDSTLTLKSFENGLVITSTELNEVPKFSQQFDYGELRNQLEPILEMRALLPVCIIAYQSHHINIINKDKKTTLRLIIEEHEHISHHVLLQPIKGYDKEAENVSKLLISKLGLLANNKNIFIAALEQQNREINDYSSKLDIFLDPENPADIAIKIIYSQLLKTIKENEQGTIDDIDSEFLHDFRVAVRRTRSALSQLKNVLPDDINSHYAEFFSWLGSITSETRDLDVYLLNFERYKQDLPVAMRESLNPFQAFLHKKQQQAQQQLATELSSSHYLLSLSAWQQYLEQPVSTNCHLTIKELADKRVWKNFQRVLKEGAAISELSPAEALHELRKSCKKLRYLMEFFQSLYTKNKIKLLLNALKSLQEVLGDFQDCTVQEDHLKQFRAEMQAMETPSDTLLAIDCLIDNLDKHKVETRSHFDLKFAEFTQQETVDTFKLLFG
jgi:CHAD domain-containing protein